MEQPYLDLMQEVLLLGNEKSDRTGIGTLSKFGHQMRFDLTKGFPLLTTKKVHLKSIIHELLWMLRGDTNVAYLQKNDVHIWDEWADADGDLGPIYGHQWRCWNTEEGIVDQMKQLVEQLKENPNSRRHIISAWNVADLPDMKLPPCHVLFQFYVTPPKQIPERLRCMKCAHTVLEHEKNGWICDCPFCPWKDHNNRAKLSCQLYQRSADIFLGLPFNIASYALLTMMVAQVTGLQAHEFIHTIGDAHLYSNHLEQAKEQLTRTVRSSPRMILNPGVKSIFDFKYEDFTLEGYDPHPAIKAPVAI